MQPASSWSWNVGENREGARGRQKPLEECRYSFKKTRSKNFDINRTNARKPPENMVEEDTCTGIVEKPRHRGCNSEGDKSYETTDKTSKGVRRARKTIKW